MPSAVADLLAADTARTFSLPALIASDLVPSASVVAKPLVWSRTTSSRSISCSNSACCAAGGLNAASRVIRSSCICADRWPHAANSDVLVGGLSARILAPVALQIAFAWDLNAAGVNVPAVVLSSSELELPHPAAPAATTIATIPAANRLLPMVPPLG